MTQYLIIAAIVLWALLYSAWSLMPAGARRAFAARAAGWARHFGLGEQEAQGLQDRLARPGGCNACSSCRGCGTPPAAPGPGVIPIDPGHRPH